MTRENQGMATLRGAAWKAQPHDCHYCGRFLTFASATADHIVPQAKGGPNEAWNVALSCAPCNNAKGDTDPTCPCERCRVAVRRARKRKARLQAAPRTPTCHVWSTATPEPPQKPREPVPVKATPQRPREPKRDTRPVWERAYDPPKDPTLRNARLSMLAARP